MNPMDINRAEEHDTAESFAFRVAGHAEIVFVSKAEARHEVTKAGVFSTPSLDQDMLRYAITKIHRDFSTEPSLHDYDPLESP